MVVLDEGNDLTAWLDVMNIFDIVVYGCVLVAFLRVIENFLEDRNILERQLTSRVALPLHVGQVEVFLHLLEHLRKEDDILSGVLKHLLAEGSLRVPESLIVFHLLRDRFLFVVLYTFAQIPLKQLVEADLILVIIAKVLSSRANNSVRNLRVKYSAAVDAMRID